MIKFSKLDTNSREAILEFHVKGRRAFYLLHLTLGQSVVAADKVIRQSNKGKVIRS